jgi:hypothetical protein
MHWGLFCYDEWILPQQQINAVTNKEEFTQNRGKKA